jgi:hypothetical protein
MIDLIDEVKIMQYFESLEGEITNLTAVINIDAAEDPHKAISNYISANKFNGIVLFVSIHEGVTDLSQGKSGYEFSIMLNAIKKVPDIKRNTMLAMRKETRECLIQVLGHLMEYQEQYIQAMPIVKWQFARADERVLPTHEMANAKAFGHNTGIEIYADLSEIYN